MSHKRAHFWSLWLASAVLVGIAIGATLLLSHRASPTLREQVVALTDELRAATAEGIALSDGLVRGNVHGAFASGHARHIRRSLERARSGLESSSQEAARRGDAALAGLAATAIAALDRIDGAWARLRTAPASDASRARAELATERVALDELLVTLESPQPAPVPTP